MPAPPSSLGRPCSPLVRRARRRLHAAHRRLHAAGVRAAHRRRRRRGRPAARRPGGPAPRCPTSWSGGPPPSMTLRVRPVAVPRDWGTGASDRRAGTDRPSRSPCCGPGPRSSATGSARWWSTRAARAAPASTPPSTSPSAGVRRAAHRDHRPVRHRRLRPARGRPVQPGQVHLRRRPGRQLRLDPDPVSQAAFDGCVGAEPADRPTAAATKYGDQLPLYSHRAGRPGHGRGAGRRRRREADLPRATPTAPCSAPRTPSSTRSKVRALVLDGAVDPQQGWSTARRARPRASSGRSTTSPPGARRTPAKCPIAPDARAAVTTAIDKAQAPRCAGADGREATAGWVFYAVISVALHRVGLAGAGPGDRRAGATATRTGVFRLADAYAERDDGRALHQPVRRQPGGQLRRRDETPDRGADPPAAVASGGRSTRCSGRRWRSGMLSCSIWPGGRDPYPTGRPTARRRSWWWAPPATRPRRTSRPPQLADDAGRRPGADLGGRGAHRLPADHAASPTRSTPT